MTVSAIPAGAGQASVSAGGSSISSEAAGYIPAGSGSSGAATAGGDTGLQKWHQSLNAAGVSQRDASTQAAEDASHLHTPAQLHSASLRPSVNRLSGLNHNSANHSVQSLPHRASEEDSNLTGTSHSARDKAGNSDPAQKKDVSAPVDRVSLLATLSLPAEVTTPVPCVPAGQLTHPVLQEEGLDGKPDHAERALMQQRGSAADGAPNPADPALGHGIAAKVTEGIQPHTESANSSGASEGSSSATAADAATTTTLPPDTSRFRLQALDAAPLAGGNGVTASRNNLQPSAHPQETSAPVASQTPHAGTSAAKAPTADAASLHAQAAPNRNNSLGSPVNSGVPTSSNPAQLTGGQVQPVAAAAQSTLNGQGAHNGSTTPSIPASGAHSTDPFATLDASAPANPATWTHAGANTAEAGYQDPSLGWVGVRAQSVSAGAIHASVLPSSSDAAQALSGHLAGLHAYLADHHALTGTVTVARPESSASWSGSGQQTGQNHGHNQGGQGSSQGGNPQSGHFWGNSPIHSNPSAGSVHSSNPHPSASSSVTRAAHNSATQAGATTHAIPRDGGLISVVA